NLIKLFRIEIAKAAFEATFRQHIISKMRLPPGPVLSTDEALNRVLGTFFQILWAFGRAFGRWIDTACHIAEHLARLVAGLGRRHRRVATQDHAVPPSQTGSISTYEGNDTGGLNPNSKAPQLRIADLVRLQPRLDV